MKFKRIFILTLVTAFIFGLSFNTALADQEKEQEKQKEEEKKPAIIYIPNEIKTIMESGLPERMTRNDIPFSIHKNLYFIYGENILSVFVIKAKNSDLKFAPPFPVLPVPEKKAPEKKNEEPQQQEEQEKIIPTQVATELQSNINVFIQFYVKEGEGSQKLYRELYIPFNLKVDAKSFDLEKEDYYFTSYPLPPGDYVMAMALTSRDLQQVGTQYYEFSLPNPAAPRENLETTSIFSAKKIERKTELLTKAMIHREFFRYSYLEITPIVDNIFAPEVSLELFFFVMGLQMNEQNKPDFDINYEVIQGDKKIIRFSPQKYTDIILVCQPLPLKKTVLVRTEKNGEVTEKKEIRNLDPGEYQLVLSIKDNLSGKTGTATLDFSIKGPEEVLTEEEVKEKPVEK